MIPFLQSLRPDFAPGAKMRYSNSGYVILGFIIQKASGMSYWKAVRKYIFEPLKMNSSGFDFAHLAKKEKATGYAGAEEAAIITDSTVPSAAGAIYSTVSDLYNFHRVHHKTVFHPLRSKWKWVRADRRATVALPTRRYKYRSRSSG